MEAARPRSPRPSGEEGVGRVYSRVSWEVEFCGEGKEGGLGGEESLVPVLFLCHSLGEGEVMVFGGV